MHITSVDSSKSERKCSRRYLRWEIKTQNSSNCYRPIWGVTIIQNSAPDIVSNAPSVRKMGNELWQADPSAGHRLRIQTKTHVAGRISLTSNPSANWHVELTPIATCQSPFNPGSDGRRLGRRSQEVQREGVAMSFMYISVYSIARVSCPRNVWGEGLLLTSSANLHRNYSTRLFPPSAVS